MEGLTRDNLDQFGILKPLDSFSMELKQRMTFAENKFYQYLKENRLIEGVLKQPVFGWYILDFVFTKRGVAVELDGPSHLGKEQYDAARDRWIKKCGLTVLRFSNETAINNPRLILKEVNRYEPEMLYRRALLRANSQRQVENELKLAEKGLRHANCGELVPLSYRTKRQLEFEGVPAPNSVVDLPSRQKASQLRCSHCGEKTRANVIRCGTCLVIQRIGWIGDETPVIDVVGARRVHKAAKVLLYRKEAMGNAKQVTIKNGRLLVDGKRMRPRCPNCQTPASSTWKQCKFCLAKIIWE